MLKSRLMELRDEVKNKKISIDDSKINKHVIAKSLRENIEKELNIIQ